MRSRLGLAVAGVMCATAVMPRMAAAADTTRTVYVTVVDDKGQAVPNLAAEDFAVKEGGKDVMKFYDPDSLREIPVN